MSLFPDDTSRGATLSICRTYRYLLWRIWDPTKPFAVFVMCNPSTADADVDDATIRKCVGFCKRWGYGGFKVINLFAIRSTDPAGIRRHKYPIGGDENDEAIRTAVAGAAVVIAAWGGIDPDFLDRATVVGKLLERIGMPLYCLGTTKAGDPRHPLMLAYSTPLAPFTPRMAA